MKIAILGAGALGSLFAAYLKRAGADVTLIARPARAAQIEREGVRVVGLSNLTERVPVTCDPQEVASADLAIVALKTQQSAGVLPQLKLSKPVVAFSLQNGVYKNSELAATFGAGQVLGAAAFTAAEMQADGTILFTLNEQLLLGERAPMLSERASTIAHFLDDAGLRSKAVDNIVPVEWSKYAVFVAMFCLAVITRQETHRFLSHPEGAAMMAALLREMAQLAAAEGIGDLVDNKFFPMSKLLARPLAEISQWVRAFGAQMACHAPRHKVSALQDLERNRPTEYEETVGYAARRARVLGVPTSALDACAKLCATIAVRPV